MDIPEHLRDSTTFLTQHSVWTHLFCVLLRCLLAMYLWTAYDSSRDRPFFTVLCITIITIFTFKYFNVRSWKVFSRVVLVYTTILVVLHVVESERAKTVAGMLVIVDALMGLQSRYIATLLTT
jgi:hypothetical protein